MTSSSDASLRGIEPEDAKATLRSHIRKERLQRSERRLKEHSEALRDHVLALPSIEQAIHLALRLGGRTSPAIRCAGVSLNTSKLDEADARRLMREEAKRLGCPVADPMRGGAEFEALVEACLA